MKFALSDKTPDSLATDCLVVFLGKQDKSLPPVFPEATRKQVSRLIKDGDFSAAASTHLVHQPEGLKARRLLLARTGSDKPLNASAWLRCASGVAKAVAATGAKRASVCLPDKLVAVDDPADLAALTVRALGDSAYRFDSYRSKTPPAASLTGWTLLVSDKAAGMSRAVKQAQAMVAGADLARDLGNQPPNVCHPEYLVGVARDLERQYDKLKATVISEKQAEKMGMGAFCAVARGSEHDGKLIALEYRGAAGRPVALVGKGITFDTGGISLKPGAAMDEMKYDMCGAASVFGVMKAVCEMDLPIHLVMVVAAAENMPDGRASRPGDIVKTLSGQTVEILNTDAEGRLVLCDALTWTQQKFKPHTIVDVATLTGACVVALGSHAQAVYSNDDTLSQQLLAAGEATGDRGWPMPLWDDYQEQLDSPFADMANIGGPKGGSITAACFLSRFAEEVKWAHLDIAGTAWVSGGKQKGATGRPVPMLTRFLMDMKKKSA